MVNDFFSTLELGTRVVIRYRLPLSERGTAGENLTDALGVLSAVEPDRIEVLTRTGTLNIARTEITHAKTVPPPPERRVRR